MQKIATIAGHVGATPRDGRPSVKHRLLEIGRIARGKGAQRQEKTDLCVQGVSEGEVIAFLEVGGLHHRYERRAA